MLSPSRCTSGVTPGCLSSTLRAAMVLEVSASGRPRATREIPRQNVSSSAAAYDLTQRTSKIPDTSAKFPTRRQRASGRRARRPTSHPMALQLKCSDRPSCQLLIGDLEVLDRVDHAAATNLPSPVLDR